MQPDVFGGVPHAASANVYFYENGKQVSGRRVFSPDALLGLTLILPRSLGTVAVTATLATEGEEGCLSLPLSFVEWEGESEVYAVLFDSLPPAPSPLRYLTLSLEGAYGRLWCSVHEDGAIGFSSAFSESCRLPLLLLDEVGASSALVGGSLFCLPVDRAAAMCQDETESLLFTLSSLGVRGVYFSPPSKEGASDGEAPSISAPLAFLGAARERGMSVLADLLLLFGVTEHPDLLFGGFCSPPSPNAPIEEEPRPAFWESPLSRHTENASSLAACFGEGGIVAEALRAGYNGLVVRAADCFGDAFLSALRGAFSVEENALLLGATESGGVSIAFGARRRFFFGGELDAPISYQLRRALLAYFLWQDTRPLASYLHSTLELLPPSVLASAPNLLSDGALGYFEDALAEGNEYAAPLAELSYLVAATLPGVPAYFVGEEERAAALLRRLALLRRREPTYERGAFRLLHLSPTLLAFAREGGGESLVTVINPSEEPLTITSPDEFFVVYGGRGRKGSFIVRPRSGAVLKASLWEGEACRLYFSHT